MEFPRAERVYTITDWYDGARTGMADYQGQPHYYECLDWENAPQTAVRYALTPLDAETVQLALEGWAMWQRWQAAYKAGRTTEATHPALPEDHERHIVLQDLLRERLRTRSGFCQVVQGTFHYGREPKVEWRPFDALSGQEDENR